MTLKDLAVLRALTVNEILIFDGLTAEEFTTVLITCKVLEFFNFYSASEVSLTRAAFSASEILVTADVWSEFS